MVMGVTSPLALRFGLAGFLGQVELEAALVLVFEVAAVQSHVLGERLDGSMLLAGVVEPTSKKLPSR
ncbi:MULTISPECIES: hypothetical protein [unclassified Streptomyces]|uniref:hypothetical protein n=1 Tax=unclassified Streptomyces TaxID=2593676 RepID=UPI00056477D2|nr:MULTISPECIES: hypothetical protein [unclassified Streptomyces]